MPVVMGFADLLIQMQKIDGDSVAHLVKVRDGSTEFARML